MFVRLSCLCADLGFTFQQFIEEAYFLLVKLITEDGVTQIMLMKDQYKQYEEKREKTRYAPRMSRRSHSVNVKGVHPEVYEHLDCIKKDRSYSWIVILQVLLMTMELFLDKLDEAAEDDALEREAAEEIAALTLGDLWSSGDVQRMGKTRKYRKWEAGEGDDTSNNLPDK